MVRRPLTMKDADDPKVAAAIADARRQNEEATERHPVVSQEEWLKQRLMLMEKEKRYVREGDELAREVRALPWVKVEKNYIFTSSEGDLMFTDLFKQHSQLLIKHFMMEPGQEWQCEGCSLESDHVDGLLPHFEHHDLSYVAVARAPSRKSRLCGSGWDGSSVGCRHTNLTLTTTSMCRSGRMK
jgi:predicted dithiol-disulfide oxidoreductase (DUF899 family)